MKPAVFSSSSTSAATGRARQTTPIVGGKSSVQSKSKTDGYAHLDMARATCLKLVIRHLAPSPTSDARF
jgi:hypothetical protein